MKQSDGRVLTTHTGSLPSSPALVQMFVALSKGGEVDPAAFAREVEDVTQRVVRKQLEVGIDVGNNGEQARESFFTYVQHRLSGFGGEGTRQVMSDIMAFPSFVQMKLPEYTGRTMVDMMRGPKAIGEVRHSTLEPLRAECDAYEAAIQAQDTGFAESFMTAASPGIVCAGMPNEYYDSYEDYVFAVAEAMRPEYEEIVSRGFALQLDCPDLAMERHTSFGGKELAEFQRFGSTNIEAINRAIEGLPRDRIRLHACWGNYEGPHHHDVSLEDVLPLIYEAEVGAFVLPLANPRHAHEWRLFERYPLPADALIVAGVIDTTTNYVEHPEVVAERIERVTGAVGDPSRVLAGTDCGFGTAAGFGEVAEEVVWEKLRSLRAGADLASKRLFA
jgi:5-methyltetrahydropteroyltriglutamate--homocysteine methyltransferase